MVYCGKPSGSCHACRERKTKCDQVPEGCTQCKRAKRTCPGYRVPGDLIFRNESLSVVRKAKAKEEKLRARGAASKAVASRLVVRNKDSEGEDEEALEFVQREDTSLSLLSLAPTLEDMATNYFVANYVFGMDGPSRGNLEYVPDVTRSRDVDDGLLYSMQAVGLAGFAHFNRAPSLMANARYLYLKAIQETNRALKDPVGVKKDGTLLSIMILGIFETVTGIGTKSISDWEQHLKGAAAVIKLRGPSQVATPAGRRMLIQATASILISCIQRAAPLPAHLEHYMSLAMSKFPQTERLDPAILVQAIMMKFCTFRHVVIFKKLTDLHEILGQALDLDTQLFTITHPSPPGWEYETVLTDIESQFVWRGKYHVYHDSWVAQMWNAVRTMRILLNGIIRSNLLAGLSQTPPVFEEPLYYAQLQASTKLLYEQQEDILCSVPQHVGCFPKELKPFTPNPNLLWLQEDEDGNSVPTIKQSGGSFLVWPLWLAGMMDVATEEVKDFVCANLKAVGAKMGIRQAVVLAEVLEKRQGLEGWKEDIGKARSERNKGVNLISAI